MRVSLAPLALAMLVFIPAGSAQALVDAETSISPAELQVARGGTYALSLTVENRGTAPGQATLTFGAAPDGWTLSANATSFTVGGGSEETVALTLQLSDAAATGRHTITVTTTLVVSAAGQELDRDQHTAEVTGRLTLDPYQRLNDELGGWLPFALAGLGVLLLIVVVLLTRRQRPLEVLARTQTVTAEPGTTATFHLAVANRSRRPDTARLFIEGLPPGWAASLTRTSLDLRPRRQAPVELAVAVPPGAAEAQLDVVATGRSGEGRVRVRVKAGITDATAGHAPPNPTYTDFKGDIHPVEDVEGIGKAYSERLRMAGIETTARLCYEDAATLAGLISAPEKTIRQWQDQAQLMKVNGIGPQYAEALARAGIDLGALKRDTAATIAYQVNAYLERLETNVLGQQITEARVKAWQKRAKAMRRVKQAVPKA